MNSHLCIRLLHLLGIVVFAFSVTHSGYAAARDVLTVAVFDFESKDEPVRDMGPKVATLINAQLSATDDLITVERAELEKALGEQELSLSGTVAPETASKVGQLTGAKVLITGRVFKADKDLVVVAKIIGTETSRVYGEMAKAPAGSDITELTATLSEKIAKRMAEKRETLVAKVETREQQIDRIVAGLKEGKRPAVSVKIAERHFGAPVIDPAAETELSILLQKAGFTVVDDKAETKPDIEIAGEAFSALAVRKGNLISCRARIELKAHDRKTGKLLTVDRQTSVAVDVAEQIAAKNALQNVTVAVSERLLPALIQ